MEDKLLATAIISVTEKSMQTWKETRYLRRKGANVTLDDYVNIELDKLPEHTKVLVYKLLLSAWHESIEWAKGVLK